VTQRARSHLRSVPSAELSPATELRHAAELRPAAELSQEELIRRSVEGDQRAFAVLYKAHARYIAGVAYRLLGHPAEVDDVVQDTFVAALRGLAQLQEPAALRRWLIIVATRQVQLRVAQRTRKYHISRDLVDVLREKTDAETATRVDDLYDALSRLDSKVRLPWILVRVEGQALSDAAEACEISLATLKRRLATADDRVKKRLGGHG
jgi:RNA polymerase sigma-70 factor, ECF subfamily